MSLCINPACPHPSHPGNTQSNTCQSCHSQLLLQHRYRVMRLLSDKTGFGTVYEAYERDTPKILKVLKPDRSENSKVLRLFQKEAEVLSQIQHTGVPYIARDGYFTYLPENSDTPLHCIVMEKIDGPNLQQWMQQQGNHPISEQQALRWLTQLTEILRRVHQHNYFHRDIKPDNVMLRANGQIVLVDFGAAREMTQTYLAQIGSLGVTTVSSAGYTPPEQEQGQAVPQSDFFALGRTLIYLLTGLSPNDTALYDPMLNTFDWRGRAPQVSPAFAALLDTLIAPRVVDRPKTAQEILDRLHQLLMDQPLARGEALTRFPETAMPSSPLPVAPKEEPADQSAHGTVQQQRRTLLQRGTDRITGWTWLIAGGVTFIALAILGIGRLGQQRLQPSPAIEGEPQLSGPENSPTPPITEISPALPVTLIQEFIGHGSSINALHLLSDKQRFISASADSTIRLWNLSTGEVLQTLDGHRAFVNAIALSPDEKTLYSGSADGTLYQWNLATGEQQAEFVGHISAVNALVKTPDGQRLVSGAADGTLIVWDTQTQSPLHTLAGHAGAINALVITRDGQRIISGGADLVIQIWDIQSGEGLQTLTGHESFINAIAVSPNGQTVFSAGADETIRRWNPNTGEMLGTFTEHESYVNVLTFSHDGRTVSSGSADGTVRVWNVKNGELLKTYTGFGMPIDHVVFPSNNQLVTATRSDAMIKTWSITP